MKMEISLEESKVMLELLEQKVNMPQYADVAKEIESLIFKIRFPLINLDFLEGK